MIDFSPPPVKLICAITYAPQVNLEDVFADIEAALGAIDDRSMTIDFNHTNYYTPEMGPDLKKLLVSFEKPFWAEDLWLAKKTTVDLEGVYSESGKRKINLDPGYLEPAKLVLASTKNYSHRIYLNQGIWAEVTLIYTENKFQNLPWTYPDYLQPEFIDFLTKARNRIGGKPIG